MFPPTLRVAAAAAVLSALPFAETPRPGDSLDLLVSSNVVGTGEILTMTVDGGPGDFVAILAGVQLQQTVLPGIGTLDIALNPFPVSYNLPPLPPSGSFSFDCGLKCGNKVVGKTFYLQAVGIDLNDFSITISNLQQIDTTDAHLPDCNGNGRTDICDLQGGFSQDCNGNERPDECDIQSGDSLDLDGNAIPDECQDCVAYPPPAGPLDRGTWRLGNTGTPAAGPPGYGLRLDGLCDDYPEVYSFDFEHPSSDVRLTWDGECLRLFGYSYGGIDDGDEYDDDDQGLAEIEFTWKDVEEHQGHLRVTAGAETSGSIRLGWNKKEVALFGKANGDGLIFEFFGAATPEPQLASGHGWVQFAGSEGKGCCRDFEFTATPIPTECP